MHKVAERITSLPRLVSKATGIECSRAEQIVDGGNNFSCRVESAQGPLFVKVYFYDPDDRRNRLQSEYQSLSLLWNEGIRCIPKPIACDPAERIGVYQHLDGSLGKQVKLAWDDVQQLADLLIAMWNLKEVAVSANLPAASEACMTLADYVESVDRRFERLSVASDPELDHFLNKDFAPFWAELRDTLVGSSLEQACSKTISPSDHGFHNAIKQADGNWIFFDFEYAGWDDPAKMIADALHQPKVPIPEEFSSRFAHRMFAALRDDDGLSRRFQSVYPAVGMKWCLLLLNEFLPISQQRRQHAGRCLKQQDSNPSGQLLKAKAKLDSIKHELFEASPGS